MNAEQELSIVAEALTKILDGNSLSDGELYRLSDISSPEGCRALKDGAAAVTSKFIPSKFDSCTIVNARSGLCSENCKWCAQSSHYSTGCETYELVDYDAAIHSARYNADKGVGRYSLVASGRAVRGKNLEYMTNILREASNLGISTCASMGLLNKEELQKLYDAGVRRYHCNLETAPSHFKTLCTTHTQEDKLTTISQAKEIGFEICCGGIIGMGETRRQRMEFAIKLREIKPASIPVNILCKIPGTPLENTETISDEDILLAIAYFRFANPTVILRFAGGRARLPREIQLEAMRIGISGAIIGDLLTTIGSTINEDKELAQEAGYRF